MMNAQQHGTSAGAKRAFAVLMLAVICGDARSSAPANEAPRVRAASEGSTVPYLHPPIKEDRMLKGVALLSALRQGGFVLFLRHTQTGTVTPECTVSNLTPAGERDARFIGESMRKLRIPVDRVLSSPVCRVFDTAKLLQLGEAVPTRDLSNVSSPAGFDLLAARTKRLAEAPAKGANSMLVSHMHAGTPPAHWIYLDFGEIIVYQPDGHGGSEARARIRADDWYDLMTLDKKE